MPLVPGGIESQILGCVQENVENILKGLPLMPLVESKINIIVENPIYPRRLGQRIYNSEKAPAREFV